MQTASVAVKYSVVLGGIRELTTIIAAIVPTIRCGESCANMTENAFNPDNNHLWVRCKAHESGENGPERCVFVEDCDDCMQDCLHDWGYLTHDIEN
jgi:hypothetical protein